MRALLLVAALLLGTLYVRAQSSITLAYPRAMLAGDAWLLSLGGLGCETAEVALLNGLALHRATVRPDRNGDAAWGLPEGVLSQAGDMRLRVVCGAVTVERVVRVLPGTVATLDAFPVANAITAYGEAHTEVIALYHDRYGNPAAPPVGLAVTARYPDGTAAGLAYRLDLGLAVATLASQGPPGRVRLAVTAGAVRAGAELMQAAGPPSVVRLDAPACALSDGRDLIPITVSALDAYGYPVNDGTALRLAWGGGGGVAVLRDGRGLVRVPPPATGTLAVTVPGFDAQVAVGVREDCDG